MDASYRCSTGRNGPAAKTLPTLLPARCACSCYVRKPSLSISFLTTPLAVPTGSAEMSSYGATNGEGAEAGTGAATIAYCTIVLATRLGECCIDIIRPRRTRHLALVGPEQLEREGCVRGS